MNTPLSPSLQPALTLIPSILIPYWERISFLEHGLKAARTEQSHAATLYKEGFSTVFGLSGTVPGQVFH